MRDFKFICKRCDHRIQTRTIYAGELIACPVCEGEIVIPQPPASPSDPPPTAYPPGEAPPAPPPPPPQSPAAEPPSQPTGGFSPFTAGYEFDSPELPTAAAGLKQEATPPRPPESGPPESPEPEPAEEPTGEPGPEEDDNSRAEQPPSEPPAPESGPSEPDADDPSRTADSLLAGAEATVAQELEPKPDRGPTLADGGPLEGTEPPAEQTLPAPPIGPEDTSPVAGVERDEPARTPPLKEPAFQPPPSPPSPAEGPMGASPFTRRPDAPPPGPTQPSQSPFSTRPQETKKKATVTDREGPHTGVLMLAVNALIILIVVAVVLIPRNGKAPATSPNLASGPSMPNVPEWPTVPEQDATSVVSDEAKERVQEAISSLLASLARNDLLGAARWIVPSVPLNEVTNRLAPLTSGLAGTSNRTWRLDAPLTASAEGLGVAVRASGEPGHRVEFDFRDTSVGWRVARLQWSGPTSAAPLELDFAGPAR